MLEDYEGSRTEFMKMLAEQDCPPAYVLRAQRVEQVWQSLVAECRIGREELLTMPKMRLAKLAAFVDQGWDSLQACGSKEYAGYLATLHEQWQPELRSQIVPAVSERKIRSALKDLEISFSRFNHRWKIFAMEVNLSQVNYERKEYNNWYLVEKSAALGSDRLAEMGFEPLPECTHSDILRELPLLMINNASARPTP